MCCIVTLVNVPAASIPAADLAEITSLYDAGRYVTAHARAVKRFGPLATWRGGAAALVFAGRLAGNVGGHHLGYALILRARRTATAPADRAAAALFHAFRVYGRRGPLAARRLLGRADVRAALAAGADDETRADVLCLRAHIAAAFRDEDAAGMLWEQAHALAPTRPWTWRERAALLVALDQYPEALDAARESLRLQAWYRPAVEQAAHILTLLNRDDEAVALLENALDPGKGGLESASAAGLLAGIYAELQRPADALRALERLEAWSPLLEDPGRQSLAARRGEARLLLNDLPGAAAAADALAPHSFFHAKTAERLRDPERQAARRVTLPVPFVRQHEKTCAPATLAALSRYWNRPADQADIAREIWYGGTFDHQERRWAETHGWAAREFRADWASAVALLDLEIPFTLVTTGVNSGHLQAGIGYDARRGTLTVRDPYERQQREVLADEFFAQHAFSGPRAMALVPADAAGLTARLAAVDLPETALHDGLYRLRCALHVHDRSAARAALDALESLDPGTRLTLFGRRELALYDGDDPALLAAVEGLLVRFPDSRLRLEKLYALRRLARPLEARACLEEWVADPAQSEPNLWRELAVELATDARQRSRARQGLARVLFFQPTEPAHLHALATLHWDERDFAEGAALFRLAACAAMTREDFWREFFTASRARRETDEALRLLDARFQRLGAQSAQPARTLFWAHRERHAAAPAAAVLAEALQRRPDDGEILLFAATVHARDGEHDRAAEFLDAARGKASPGAFERAAAELCSLRVDSAGALAHWREVLAREPLDIAAHRAVARLLAETDERGPLAAREYLDAAVTRFPHAVPLRELCVQWVVETPGRGSPEHVVAVDALLAVQGTNLWALRERALALLVRHDPTAALAVLDEAERLEPLAPLTHALRGRTLLARGERAAAGLSLRCALALDVDLAGVPAALLEAYATPAEKRAALEFLHGELLRQSGSTGNGVLAYRTAAYPLLEDPELQTRLDAVLADRPDLWPAWSAVVWQHADARRLDEAHARATAAAERFPLLPAAWMDLAAVEKIRGDEDAQIAALTQALRPRADHGEASRQLASAHRRAGRFAEARTVLAQAIAAAPLDVANRGALAETLWQEDRQQHGAQALEILADALCREPGYDREWSTLERYAAALGQPERLEAAARVLTTTRPGEARSWLRLAQSLPDEDGPVLTERLAVLDRALTLTPRSVDAHDLRAVLLAGEGRFDEALAACEPFAEIYPGGTRPFTLEGRAAWVLARRGNLHGARERMRAVLADQPEYEWGWRQLADWAEAAGDKAEALAAAERLAFLDPHAAGPLGYVAAARLQLGQRAEAKRDLREAMRRDPAYLYAPITLLREQLDDHEFEAAEQTLAFFQKHHPGALALSRTVLVAARGKEPRRAGQALELLARLPPAPNGGDGGLGEAVDAVLNAGWHDAVERVLGEAMRASAGACHPETAAYWARARTARKGGWKGLEADLRRLPGDALCRAARLAVLSVIAEQRLASRLPGFVRRMRRELRADTESWGQAGYALVACGFHWRATRWLTDWRERLDIKCWMLLNLAVALRASKRHEFALCINRDALTLPPDHTRGKHLVWVALEDALSYDPNIYKHSFEFYKEIEGQGMETGQPFRYLRALAGHVLAIRREPDTAGRQAAWKAASVGLRAERKKAAGILRGNPAVRRAEYRARRRMARDAGAGWTWLGLWLFALPQANVPLKLASFMFFWIFGVGTLIAGAILLAGYLGLI